MNKKIVSMILSFIMIFSFCVSVTAEQTVENTEVKTYSVEIPESAMKRFAKDSMTEANVNEVFASIESSVRKYFEEYNINPGEFVWPEYERDGLDEIDEDNCWMYLNIILVNYQATGEKYLTEGFEYQLPGEEHVALMNAVLDGFVAWAEKYQADPSDPMTASILLTRLDEVIYPLGDKLPEIIVFTQE